MAGEITPAYVCTMAKYNRWMNDGIYSSAATLDDSQRRADMGAFFNSIHGTLNHVLWGDQIWMNRFAGTPIPVSPDIPGSVDQIDAFDDLTTQRKAFDEVIMEWANGLDPVWLEGDLSWFSGAAQREVRRPKAELVIHMFNHQTHHRGQVHAMLTRLGARTAPTDLPFMSL